MSTPSEQSTPRAPWVRRNAPVWFLNLPNARPQVLVNAARRSPAYVVRDAARRDAEAVVEAIERARRAGELCEVTPPVKARLIWRAPDFVERDNDGLANWGKAVIDAIVRAGVLKDDNYKLVVSTEFQIDPDPDNPGMSVELIPVMRDTSPPMPPTLAQFDLDEAHDAVGDAAFPATPLESPMQAHSFPTAPGLRLVPVPDPPATESRLGGIEVLEMGPCVGGAENLVAQWLQAATDHEVTGIACWAAKIPRTPEQSNSGATSWEVDLIVFTREQVTVFEVKRPDKGEGGELHYPANGHWYFADRPDEDPFRCAVGKNPANQAGRYVMALRDFIAETLGEKRWVDGAVVVVPWDADITLGPPPRIAPEYGIKLFVGDGPDKVHSYLRHAGSKANKMWDAGSVLKILQALDPRVECTYNHLVKLGFPEISTSVDVAPRPALPAIRQRAEVELARPSDNLPARIAQPQRRMADVEESLPAGITLRAIFVAVLIAITAGAVTVACEKTRGAQPADPRPAVTAPQHDSPEPTPEREATSVPPAPTQRPYTQSRPCYPFQEGC